MKSKIIKTDLIKQNKKEKNKIDKTIENNTEFNERINLLKNQTKSSFKEKLEKDVAEKRKKYFEIVDKLIIEIIYKLKNDIEKDAKGENTIGYPKEIFEYDIMDENNKLLALPISELFRFNLQKRISYKNLEKECNKYSMKVNIIPIDIGHLDPNNVHPLEPSFENYKIIIKKEDENDKN